MNKLRLKFSKNGPIKFIGHLDVMRYFQKAIRRAEIDIKYSEGFSPHQVISFAQPLSVGATSDGEYMDITVNSMTSANDVMDRLNSVMNEGIEILAIEELSDSSEKAMTAAYAAKYKIRFRESLKPDFDWISEFKAYLLKETLPAMKKTKSGEKEIDMKPMIYDYSFSEEDESVTLLLSMSSASTLKPALLFDYFFKSMDKEIPANALDIHRIDIYRLCSDDGKEYIEPFITNGTNERFYLNV
ncbi:TIGR03936 family radical SAM-associated protein [Butyrivibrio sp. YAB3001]|uniref:TIGR03936 family radical SAM-associated protein n=1 Tax=Butyrivibrio sp. YAB3001 TaxID=1520812 RepID=UPI0008F63EFB|nr:TIGR03936 family radical SAM-associated protein [Butyrivibrio sp. YAB3001]SFB67448.1 radical SAM-linked protein [Butyrivibrio sp. YAB3001]